MTTSSVLVSCVCIEFVDQKKDRNVRREHAGVINATDTGLAVQQKVKYANERDRGTGRVNERYATLVVNEHKFET